MPHRRTQLQSNERCLGTALALMLVFGMGLTACSRSASVSSAAVSSLPPDQIQTLHQDYVAYMWANGDCPTSPPPPVRSAGSDQVFVGEETWPSGGKAGYECATSFRTYMAGARFPLGGVDVGATTHAQLAFRLQSPDGLGEPPAQTSECAIDVLVAAQEWAHEDPTQLAADPYAVLSPSQGSAMGSSSAHTVAYDSGTQTVTVDASAAVGAWVAQRQPNQGFLFKQSGGCHLTRLSGVTLILGQG